MYYGSMRRGTIISALLHVAVLLALIITFPSTPLQQPPEVSYDFDMVGPSNAPPAHSAKTGKTPAENQGIKHAAQEAQNKPKPQPIETAPPPPPPPPPSPPVSATTPVTRVIPAPPPPPPTFAPTVPTPPVTPVKPQKTQAKPHPAKPTKPAPHPVTVAPDSPTHQQHETKVTTRTSPSMKKTLLDIKAIQQQLTPPTHVYNPDTSTDTDPGGSPDSTANSQLSGADKNAIGQHLHPCFNVDAGAPGVSTFHVLLDITTDATGTIREATVDPQDQDKLSDPLFNAYAQQAQAAALNYQCATLPLPQNMLGSTQNFQVEFVGQ